MTTWTVGYGGNFLTIQFAIDSASVNDGDTLILDSDVFNEDINFSKSLTILGAKAGLDGTDAGRSLSGFGETTLIGHHKITAAGPVTIDGVRFVNDATTTGGGPSNPTLQIQNGNDHVVTNSIFWSDVAGGARPSPDDRAISTPVIADGEITISDNLFTGSSTGAYATASWGRAIWFDGGGVDLNVDGNTIEYARTGINADMTGDSTLDLTNNLFHTNGTALALGVDQDGVTLDGNSFQNVSEEINTRNLSSVDFNLADTNSSVIASGMDNHIVVLGGNGDDTLSGSDSTNDILDGNNFSSSHVDNDTLSGRGGDDFLYGKGGNDVLNGGAGADTVDGGAGSDTAVFSGNFADYDVSGLDIASGSVSDTITGPDGTDTLSSIEVLKFGDGYRVLEGMSIQAAIDAAHVGETIYVEAGTYNEQLTVNKGVTIIGVPGAILNGPLQTQLGYVSNGLDEYLQTNHSGYASSAGFTVTANNVSISGFTVQNFSSAVVLTTSDSVSITGNTFNDNVRGVVNDAAFDGLPDTITNFTFNDNSVSNGVHGIVITAISGGGSFDGITMDDNQFSGLSEKGVYFEMLSNASATGNSFDDVGNYGRISPPFGGTDGAFGSALELNFKFEDYSNITFTDTEISNSGYSNKDGATSSHSTGNAVSVKLRDDAPSYGGDPATFTGTVVFDGLSIDGTSTGVRVGEPAKNNLGPDVQINDLSIVNAAVSDVDNVTHATNGATVTANLADSQVNLDASSSQAPVAVTGNDLGNTIEGGSGDDCLDGSLGHDTLLGNNGNDTLTGGGDNDAVDGGAGTDTAVYAETLTASNFAFAAGEWTITTTGQGVDTLTNIEVVDHGGANHILLVGGGGYASIQAAINAADPGDTIMVAEGTYHENLIVNEEVTIVGIGEVVLEGTFKTDNSIAGTVADFLKTAASYTGAAGTGISIEADNVTISNIKIDSYLSGVNLGNGIDNVTLQDVDIEDVVNGIRKGSGAEVTDFDLLGGSIRDSYIGIYFAKETATGLDISDVLISGTAFENLVEKGIYAESLSDALITGITMDNVGQFGRGPAFGSLAQVGGFGAGIDLNLKWDHEPTTDTVDNNAPYSGITIEDFTFTDVGASNKDGAAASHPFGAAIAVKARDQGSYASPETASFDGAVVIQNGTIDGTSTGIRAGEPGQNIVDPDVTISDVVITDAVHSAIHGDIANVTQSPLTFTGTADDDTIYISPTSTGPVTVNGGDGVDTVQTASSHTLAADVENLTLIDGASNTEDFEDFALGAIGNGENGWSFAGAVDQEVVDDGGNQMFRMSSDPHTGAFGGPYTPALGATAGESGTTARYDTMKITFDFKAVQPEDNSRLEVDFGLANSTDRNNFMVIENIDGSGLRIAVADPLLDGDFDTGSGLNDFSAFTGNRTLLDGIDASVSHTLTMVMHFVDGQDNDIVEFYLDGALIGTSTTFENYRDALGGTHADNAQANQVGTLFFRSSAGPAGFQAPQDGPGGQNQGFLFDNIKYSVYDTDGPSGTGNALNNVITGNSGNNTLAGLGGDDSIDGGAGTDTAVYSGNWVDYTVTDNGGGAFTIEDKRVDADGTDTVSNVESFTFNGNTYSAADIVNDAPTDIDLANNTVDENAANGTVVGTLSSTDADAPLGDTATYTLVNNAGGRFAISGADIVVANAGLLDFEADPSHTVRVKVTDANGLSHEEDFIINLNDLADEAPVFTSPASFTVTEPSIAVGVVAATDADSPILSYSITGGADELLFDIDANTGALTFVDAPDFETDPHQYQIEVTASDGSNETAQTITVNLSDANDNAPVITTTSFNVAERSTLIGNVAATDVDTVGGTRTYAISGGADAALFALNNLTGALTFLAPHDFFEPDTQFEVDITASDGVNSSVQTVAVNVIDIAPTAPVDTDASANAVVEGSLSGATVGIDVSGSDGSGSVVYSIVSDTSNGGFKINAATGLVTVDDGTKLDFEAATQHTIVVGVTNSAGGATSTGSFVINLTNVNGNTIVGTKANDLINALSGPGSTTPSNVATSEADIITGGRGVDTIDALGGNDIIQISGADDASDIINGGLGTDTIKVLGTKAVTLNGFSTVISSIEQWNGNGAGIVGSKNADIFDFSELTSVINMGPVDGGAGNDTITGSKFADVLRGGIGNDTLNGGLGNDTLSGGKGVDILNGGANDDTFLAVGKDDVADTFNGGLGIDTIRATGVSLNGFNAVASSIEQWVGDGKGVKGSSGDDVFNFSGLTSVTNMGIVDAGAGNDTIIGSNFNDNLRGGAGNDSLNGGLGTDTLTGGAGNDTFVFSTGFGADTVTDYGIVVDQFDLSGTGITNYTALRALMTQVSANVVRIDFGGADTLTINKTTIAILDLHQSDFTF